MLSVPVWLADAALAVSEREFQATVVAAAKALGFGVYHTHRSDRSEPGFPDLTLAKPGRLIFAELKRQTGRVSTYQAWWLNELSLSVRGVETYVWRPSDWPEIERILKRDR